MKDSTFVSRRAALASLLAWPAAAQNQNPRFPYPPELPGIRRETYKTIGGVQLNLWIFAPDGHRENDRTPAIVFFFGGGWANGSPQQFEQHCRHLASRGMVAITADYRVASRNGVKAIDCVRDAKSAIRWVRSNSASLGIDSNRIAAGGGSAGGHLAAATGVIDGLEEQGEKLNTSSRPNALVLFNPVLALCQVQGFAIPEDFTAKFDVKRLGIEPRQISPYDHVQKSAPPAIIFHGKADTTVPFVTAEAFTQKMAALGNRSDLEGYEGQTHGFFNYGRAGSVYFEKTLKRADEFLVSIGYLNRKPS